MAIENYVFSFLWKKEGDGCLWKTLGSPNSGCKAVAVDL
jgi:hypothetical protein